MYKSTDKLYIRNKRILQGIKSKTSHSHYAPRQLKCHCYPNAYVRQFSFLPTNYGGGVVREDGKVVFGTCLHNPNHEWNPEVVKSVKVIHEDVLYIGCIYDCWGHLITDSLAKIWYLSTPEGKRAVDEADNVIFITDGKVPDYAYHLFLLLGIDLHKFVHVT